MSKTGIPKVETKNFEIHYLGERRRVKVKEGESILSVSLKNKIHHPHVCGGNAMCSSCRIAVSEGLANCLPRNRKESAVAKTLKLDSKVRLACQTRIKGDIAISKPPFDELGIKLATLAIADGTSHQRGEIKKLSIMFMDIENFTPLVESMPAYDVVYFLNYFFYQMGTIVEKHHAKIIDYYGDGFLSVFGFEKSETMQEDSVLAGLEIFETLRQVGKRVREFSYPDLNVRIGVRTGKVVIGTIGTEKMRKLAVMGDAVNMASRIESKNKELKTQFLICNDTHRKVSNNFNFGKSYNVEIKGKSGKHKLWEVKVS